MNNLPIKIIIDDHLSRSLSFDFEKNIKFLLDFIPVEHLVGLQEIKVIEYSPENKRKTAYGFYYGKDQGIKNPVIVICVGNLFNKIPKVVFYFIPFIPRLLLADTLFHEIGHHLQSSSHGLKKEQWENNANSYARKMTKKVFKRSKWILFIFFGPILLLQKLLKNLKIQKSQKSQTVSK